MKSSSIFYYLEFFLLGIFLLSSANSFIRPTLSEAPLACNLMYCGQGDCVASNSSLLGVDCECYPGWKKAEIAGVTLPPCLLPNCTVNLSCSSTQPPSPILPTPQNCDFVWCGMGQCMTNGTGHMCQCVEGSDNLFGNPEFACLSQCALGSDCKNLNLGSGSSPPPSSSSASPTNVGSIGGAWTSSTGRRLSALGVMFLSAIFAAWI